ncbi:MAG: Maf-like protein [Planctomycetota bacterium]|nr:MAG: Maf-like protein [Planctomycetota bacterium]
MSYFKAAAVAERHDRAVVLAGDTVVALGDRLYGKPVDRDEAREMLLALTACPHRVITGVTLLCAATGTRRIEHDVTIVHMRPMRGAELEAYLDSGAWRGKAGAYGIQDRADAFVQRIEGSFTNVVGFPMERITSMLNDWGIRPAGGAAREPEPQRDRP